MNYANLLNELTDAIKNRCDRCAGSEKRDCGFSHENPLELPLQCTEMTSVVKNALRIKEIVATQ